MADPNLKSSPIFEIQYPKENVDPWWTYWDTNFIDSLEQALLVVDALGAAVDYRAAAFHLVGDVLYWNDFTIYFELMGGTVTVAAGNSSGYTDGRVWGISIDGAWTRPIQSSHVAGGSFHGGAPWNMPIGGLPIVWRNGAELMPLCREATAMPGFLATGSRDLSGGGAIAVADNGKSIIAANGDVVTLPAPTPGLVFHVSCSGSGTQYLILDTNYAITSAEIYGQFFVDFPAPWRRMRVYGMPGQITLVGAEISPGVMGWIIWAGNGHVQNDSAVFEQWWFGLDRDWTNNDKLMNMTHGGWETPSYALHYKSPEQHGGIFGTVERLYVSGPLAHGTVLQLGPTVRLVAYGLKITDAGFEYTEDFDPAQVRVRRLVANGNISVENTHATAVVDEAWIDFTR